MFESIFGGKKKTPEEAAAAAAEREGSRLELNSEEPLEGPTPGVPEADVEMPTSEQVEEIAAEAVAEESPAEDEDDEEMRIAA